MDHDDQAEQIRKLMKKKMARGSSASHQQLKETVENLQNAVDGKGIAALKMGLESCGYGCIRDVLLLTEMMKTKTSDVSSSNPKLVVTNEERELMRHAIVGLTRLMETVHKCVYLADTGESPPDAGKLASANGHSVDSLLGFFAKAASKLTGAINKKKKGDS